MEGSALTFPLVHAAHGMVPSPKVLLRMSLPSHSDICVFWMRTSSCECFHNPSHTEKQTAAPKRTLTLKFNLLFLLWKMDHFGKPANGHCVARLAKLI